MKDRLCSKDNTLDWRLDIWFDLVNDQIRKNKLVQGFGFNEIFEIMKDPNAPGRLGKRRFKRTCPQPSVYSDWKDGNYRCINYLHLFFCINYLYIK